MLVILWCGIATNIGVTGCVLTAEEISDKADGVSVPLSLHAGMECYKFVGSDCLPPAGATVVGDLSHFSEAPRSHTPPERDLNSYETNCVERIQVRSTVDNVPFPGVTLLLSL